MPMCNLIEYRDNYSKTSGSLYQYYRDEPNNNLTDSVSFKSKIKITGNIPADDNIKDVEIAVPLKYLSNFWRTIEMSLMNCQINLMLTWSSTCVITNSTCARILTITDTKLYVLVVIKLSSRQLNKSKSAIKNETEVVLRLSSNMTGNFDDQITFPRKLLLTNRQMANLRKAFTHNSSASIRYQKLSYLK